MADKLLLEATPAELSEAGLSYMAFGAKDCYMLDKAELARLAEIRKGVSDAKRFDSQ